MTILTVQERDETKPKQLRAAGIVPIGLVEKGKPTRKVQAAAKDLRQALSHTQGAGMLELKIDGESKKWTVLVKQVDHEPLTNKILTVTLAEISKNEEITADVAIVGTGTPEPVENGTGVLTHASTHVKIKGKAMEIPASIEVDVSGLGLAHNIHAGELQLPAGLELMSSPDTTLFSVQPLRQMEAAEEEATAEPTQEETTPEESE